MFKITTLGLCLLLAAAVIPLAKEWRGIVPLHSTRADVERLLGAPAEPAKQHASFYDLENEVVTIIYAAGPPCGSGAPSIWQVPRGTVVSVTVAPKKALRLSELRLDLSKYKRTGGGHVTGYDYYVDEDEGMKLEVSRGEVVNITYFPTAKDRHLRCPDNPQSQPVLLSSGTLTVAGKELLDSLMRRLEQEPGVTGWIKIDLEGKRAEEVERMTELICRYLKTTYPATFQRVTITQNSRLGQEIELYLIRSGEDPIPFPDKDSKLK